MSAKNLRRVFSMVAVAAAIVFGVIELVQSSDDSPSGRTASTTSTTEARESTTRPASDATPSASPTGVSNLPTVSLADLTDEALDTLRLIQEGGPYPYRQDDAVFGNRERLLPARASGYYREYTVETPGSPDRGARRIVVGANGDRYYTSDHYDSFREIVGP